MNIQQTALSALQLGLSTVPSKMDGSKAPASYWKKYMQTLPTEAEINSWYCNGQTGIGIVCGSISGNLECLDFDTKDAWRTYKETAKHSGLGGILERIETGYSEESPNGFHLLYQCEEVDGNKKLAKRASDGKATIETRGEGGYIIIAPSHGKVNVDGSYELLNGGFETIEKITPEERKLLISLARSFCEVTAVRAKQSAPKPRTDSDRPGDRFIRTSTWEQVLEPHGWMKVYTSGGTTHWRRPDKQLGISATTNYADSDLLYVFSTSTPFESEQGYNRFSAYAVLNHGGDFTAAARALSPAPSEVQEPPPAPEGALVLPNDHFNFAKSGDMIFGHLTKGKRVFRQGSAVSILKRSGSLEILTPERFRDYLDRQPLPTMAYIKNREKLVLTHKRCSLDNAKVLLSSLSTELLPEINIITQRPIIVNRGEHAEILRKGYHPDMGGILVAKDLDIQEEIPVSEAAHVLKDLHRDFKFVTGPDMSRAIAMMLTPALKLGGFIDGRTPVDVAEADQSQTGKTFRHEIVRLIYGEPAYLIGRKKGGVGSLDESIAQGLLSARPFLSLDNLRGVLDSEYLEGILTWSEKVTVRVPHKAQVEVDARSVTFQISSNGVEVTKDLANRCCVIRIRKQPEGYQWHQWPEGTLNAHIRKNQAYFLSCVFSIIRQWVLDGKKAKSGKGHAQEIWAGILDHIVQTYFDLPPIMEGHRGLQAQVSDQNLVWLRQVCLAAPKSVQLRAHDIADLCEHEGIEYPNRKYVDESQQAQHIGRIMARVFKETKTVKMDEFAVTRSTGNERDFHGNYKDFYQYEFTG